MPTLPSLSSRLAAAQGLGPAEHAVVDALRSCLAEIPELSTQQVADVAGVSRASVVRTCQSLGYSGYQQVRVLAAREAAPDRSPGDAEAAPVLAAVRALIGQVSTAAELLDEADLAATVDDLGAARRVLVVAGGLSAPVGAALAARLLRLGVAVHSLPDALDTEIVAAGLAEQDVCVAVSASGVHADTLRCARAARAAGARVIGLTSFLGTPLGTVVHREHVTPVPHRDYRDEMLSPSRLAQHVLVEALATALERALAEREPASATHDRLLEVVSGHVDE